ncbi:unnamed protein product, partial [Tenebrio molitor]
LLAYFFNPKNRLGASSMWMKYSTFKATLKVYKNIDILRHEHIEQFLKGAPDE